MNRKYIILIIFSCFFCLLETSYPMEIVQANEISSLMPNEIVFLIASELSLPDLISLSSVNKQYYSLIDFKDEIFYQHHYRYNPDHDSILFFAAAHHNLPLFYHALSQQNEELLVAMADVCKDISRYFEGRKIYTIAQYMKNGWPSCDITKDYYEKSEEYPLYQNDCTYVTQKKFNTIKIFENTTIEQTMALLYQLMQVHGIPIEECYYDTHINLIRQLNNYITPGLKRNCMLTVFRKNPYINVNRLFPLITCFEDPDYATQFLLECKADVNRIINSSNQTALFFAADKKNYSLTKLLLQYNANLEIIDNKGQTAFICACIPSTNMFIISLPLIELLIDKQANINHQDRSGNTGLHYLAKFEIKNTNKCIKKLLVAKANPLLCNNQGQSPLYYAAYYGCGKNIQKLLEYSTENINQQDDAGNTPLILAYYAYKKFIEAKLRFNSPKNCLLAIKELLAYNADPCITNKKGECFSCLINNNEKLKDSLGMVSIDPNAIDANGNSRLHNALINQQYTKALHLIEKHGACTTIVDKDNNTPLHILATHVYTGL